MSPLLQCNVVGHGGNMTEQKKPYQFKRVLIKLSGEALGGVDSPFDTEKIARVAAVLAELNHNGLEMGIVIGGGNIFRGRSGKLKNRTDGDHMGMLATAINALALKDALLQQNAPAFIMSAVEMHQICDGFTQRNAVKHIERGEIVIFACGIGRPYFSTDTASAMRALEIGAQVLLCGKNVDGVYDDDPKENPNAKRIDKLSFQDIIENDLKALDQDAIILCKNNKMPIFVFELNEPEKLIDVVSGSLDGSYIGM